MEMKLQLSSDPLKARLGALQERLKPRLRRVLAIATDGCNATGAVIRALDGPRLEIEAVATSRALKFEAVAEELMAGLKTQGVGIPKQAILLTASMLPAVLELPVAASKPLSAGQMMDMIRWELEPLFAQQIALWSIGGLLFGRGYLDEAERRELLDAHRSVQAALRTRGGRAAARFGEMAIDKGFVSREQVEECLALQEELQMTDADILIGWHPSAVGAGHDPGQSAWLCAGLSPAIKLRWVEALERAGLHVLWIYPLAGASAPLAALHGVSVALELHPLVGACYRQRDGALAQLGYHQFTDVPLSAGEALLLGQPVLRPDDRVMGLYAGRGWDPALGEILGIELKREIIGVHGGALILPAGCEVPAPVLAALGGGAAHALGLAPVASAVRLAGSKPPPPAYKRPAVWLGAAAACAAIAIAGFETAMYLQTRTLKEKDGVLSVRMEELDAAKRSVEESVRAEQDAKKQTAEIEAELERVNRRKSIYERVLVQRDRYVTSLLDALINLANDELMLYSVEEAAWQQVQITGFALRVEAVYSYARALDEELRKFGVKLGNLDTREALGPLDLTGYRFTFTLAPDAERTRR
jgi:hypothetical protein